MNYGNLIYNEIKFEKNDLFSKLSSFGDFWKCIFVLLVCFVLWIVIFNAFIVFCVIFCIYEDMLKILFHIFWKMSRSVNNVRTNCFFVIFWDWGDLGGPEWSSPPSPASMSKFPSGGKNMESNIILVIFVIFIKNGKW